MIEIWSSNLVGRCKAMYNGIATNKRLRSNLAVGASLVTILWTGRQFWQSDSFQHSSPEIAYSTRSKLLFDKNSVQGVTEVRIRNSSTQPAKGVVIIVELPHVVAIPSGVLLGRIQESEKQSVVEIESIPGNDEVGIELRHAPMQVTLPPPKVLEVKSELGASLWLKQESSTEIPQEDVFKALSIMGDEHPKAIVVPAGYVE